MQPQNHITQSIWPKLKDFKSHIKEQTRISYLQFLFKYLKDTMTEKFVFCLKDLTFISYLYLIAENRQYLGL